MGGAAAAELLEIGADYAQRTLSPRELSRVGAAILFASSEINRRTAHGEKVRDDGFFDEKTATGRGREVVEAILSKAQREPEEAKVRFLGYLVASICFDATVSADLGHQLIKGADALTYRQLRLLAIIEKKDQFDLRRTHYPEGTEAQKMLKDREVYQVLTDLWDLVQKQYIDNNDIATTGLDVLQPAGMTLLALGKDLYTLMRLDWIPTNELAVVARIIEHRDDDSGVLPAGHA